MKLAEALILRADIQSRLQEMQNRAPRFAVVQEGDTPAQDPMALLAQMNQMYTDLTDLVQRINRTNSQTAFDEEMTLADALAVRDELGSRQHTYRKLSDGASAPRSRYTVNEVRYVSTVDTNALLEEADRLAKARRELDMAIQSLNWTVDLVE